MREQTTMHSASLDPSNFMTTGQPFPSAAALINVRATICCALRVEEKWRVRVPIDMRRRMWTGVVDVLVLHETSLTEAMLRQATKRIGRNDNATRGLAYEIQQTLTRDVAVLGEASQAHAYVLCFDEEENGKVSHRVPEHLLHATRRAFGALTVDLTAPWFEWTQALPNALVGSRG